MNKFLNKFNKISNNKYSYLRLADVVLHESNSTLSIKFIVPYEVYNNDVQFNLNTKAEIFDICRKLVPENITLKINYDRILIAPEVIIRYINDFIRDKYFKIFNERYIAKDIKIKIKDGTVNITIPVDENIHSFCVSREINRQLEEFLDDKYNAINSVVFKKVSMPIEFEQKRKEFDSYIDDGVVTLQKGAKIAGEYIAAPALYIGRYDRPQPGLVTVCGRIIKFEKKISKGGKLNKKGQVEVEGKVFYVFTIEDPTLAKMRCIYFSRAKKLSVFDNVKEQDEVILSGEIKDDTYNKCLVLFVKSAYRAKIDFEATQKKIHFMKKQQLKNTVPKPQPYSIAEEKEYTLLDKQPYISPALRQRDYVVFDLETTGRDIHKCKIIEIGAVKISHGVIVSTFSTLIDPETTISLDSQQVHHISDSMVEDSPLIKDVLGVFLDYCHDCTVVGHCAKRFDIPIVKRVAEEFGYTFDNPAYDTQELQLKYEPMTTKTNLGALVDKYKIKMGQAHRALSDALATAELFIILANNLKLE